MPLVPELYFWEPELSPHKLPLHDACAGDARIGKVVYIAQAPLADARQKLGWSAEPPAHYVEAPSRQEVEAIIAASHPQSVHIFSGLHWVPSIVHGHRMAIKHQRRFGIFQEPRVWEGWKGKARFAHSWLTEHHLRQHSAFILAVGAHGPSWFRRTGYRPDRVFPFAYFLDPSESSRGRSPHQTLKVGFVGRLERTKGFHLFLEAVRRLPADLEIHIVGRGPLAGEIAALGPRAHFHGVLPMHSTRELINSLDVLVLPSITTDDGWGAVISEALFGGCYIIASQHVGASMCLADPSRGYVLSSPSPSEIVAAVDTAIGNGVLTGGARAQRSAWARAHLSAAAGKDYLLSIFSHLWDGKGRPFSFVDAAQS